MGAFAMLLERGQSSSRFAVVQEKLNVDCAVLTLLKLAVHVVGSVIVPGLEVSFDVVNIWVVESTKPVD